MSSLPVDRLRAALHIASRPIVDRVRTEQQPGLAPRLRIRGQNLTADGNTAPRVLLRGRPAMVLQASDDELVVQCHDEDPFGELEVDTGHADAAMTTHAWAAVS